MAKKMTMGASETFHYLGVGILVFMGLIRLIKSSDLSLENDGILRTGEAERLDAAKYSWNLSNMSHRNIQSSSELYG